MAGEIRERGEAPRIGERSSDEYSASSLCRPIGEVRENPTPPKIENEKTEKLISPTHPRQTEDVEGENQEYSKSKSDKQKLIRRKLQFSTFSINAPRGSYGRVKVHRIEKGGGLAANTTYLVSAKV